jgi:hypothetical protein
MFSGVRIYYSYQRVIRADSFAAVFDVEIVGGRIVGDAIRVRKELHCFGQILKSFVECLPRISTSDCAPSGHFMFYQHESAISLDMIRERVLHAGHIR